MARLRVWWSVFVHGRTCLSSASKHSLIGIGWRLALVRKNEDPFSRCLDGVLEIVLAVKLGVHGVVVGGHLENIGVINTGEFCLRWLMKRRRLGKR